MSLEIKLGGDAVTRRVAIMAFLAPVLLGVPLATPAQQPDKAYRIGVLRAAAPPAPYLEAFRRGLVELGYIEGKNVTFEYRWAEGRIDRLPGLAAELVRLKVDVIVIDGAPAALALKRTTRTTPVVMAAIGDPVAIGVVESFARPGGNFTGLTVLAPELSGKRLALLKEVLPGVSRVAVLSNSANPAHGQLFDATAAAARTMKITLRGFGVQRVDDFDSAFSSMTKDRVEALIVLADQFLSAERRRIVQLAAHNRLPTMYDRRDYVDEGGLLSYGISFPDLYRRAAVYVDKVLKGTKPGDLPVEQPTTFEMVINLKTAKALGLTIPPSMSSRADKLIQ